MEITAFVLWTGFTLAAEPPVPDGFPMLEPAIFCDDVVKNVGSSKAIWDICYKNEKQSINELIINWKKYTKEQKKFCTEVAKSFTHDQFIINYGSYQILLTCLKQNY